MIRYLKRRHGSNDMVKQILWFFINFTEPVLAAGAISSLLMLTYGHSVPHPLYGRQ